MKNISIVYLSYIHRFVYYFFAIHKQLETFPQTTELNWLKVAHPNVDINSITYNVEFSQRNDIYVCNYNQVC